MPTTPENPFADFDRVSSELYGQWERGMTSWWDQVLDNPAFLGTMGNNLSAAARARQSYETAVDESLEKAHLPTRADLVRVARIATLLEEKLLTVEDQLLATRDKLEAVEKQALLARIEAAETRLELLAKLTEMDAKLDVMTTKKPAARKSRAKKDS